MLVAIAPSGSAGLRRPFAACATRSRAMRQRSCDDRHRPNHRDENHRSFSRFARARMHRRVHGRCVVDGLRRPVCDENARPDPRRDDRNRAPSAYRGRRFDRRSPRSSADRRGARSFIVAVASVRGARRCHFGFALRNHASCRPARRDRDRLSAVGKRITTNETGSESRAPRSRAGPALPVDRGRCRPRRVDQWSSSSSSSA